MCEIRLNLIPIDVIIRQGGVDLGQRQVRVLEGNLLRSQTHFVPSRDSADGQTGAGKFRTSTTNRRVAVDQSSDFGD